jgi:hypothetical protein
MSGEKGGDVMAKAKRGRPVGTGKPAGEKYVLKSFTFPPDLWEAFAAIVPGKERSEKLSEYMRKEVAKSKNKGV